MFSYYNSIIVSFQPETASFPQLTAFFYDKVISVANNTNYYFRQSCFIYLNSVIITYDCFLQMRYVSFDSNPIILPSDRKQFIA